MSLCAGQGQKAVYFTCFLNTSWEKMGHLYKADILIHFLHELLTKNDTSKLTKFFCKCNLETLIFSKSKLFCLIICCEIIWYTHKTKTLVEYFFLDSGTFALGFILNLKSKEILHWFWTFPNVFDIQWQNILGNILPYETFVQIGINILLFIFCNYARDT